MKKNKFHIYYKYWLVSGIAMSLFSCSGTGYLREGQNLYTGGSVKIESKTISKNDKKELLTALESNLTPKPNPSILGMRPKLFFYNITKEPKTDKGFRYWMKYKLGQKPVLLGDVDREFNKDIIENYSENKGYFNAKATVLLLKVKKHRLFIL